MSTYIQSFEDNRWCVNNEPREVTSGEVVAFEQAHDAMHFVNLRRAGMIGEFNSDEEALAQLERLVEAEAVRRAAEQSQQAPKEVTETKVISNEGADVSDAPAPTKKSAKKGK
jgi:hypothetical protein